MGGLEFAIAKLERLSQWDSEYGGVSPLRALAQKTVHPPTASRPSTLESKNFHTRMVFVRNPEKAGDNMGPEKLLQLFVIHSEFDKVLWINVLMSPYNFKNG